MAVALLVAAVVFTTAPATAGAQAADIVQLQDGSFVRGTILERIEGQYVVILLPSGESRRFEWATLAFAGRAEAMQSGGPVITTVPPPPRAHIVVREQRPGLQRLTLQRLVGSAHTAVYSGYGVGYARVDAFEPLCLAPCEMDVDVGTYQFGISEGDGDGQRLADGPISLTGTTELVLDYDNRSGLRVAGWVTFAVSFVVGLALALIPLFVVIGDPRGTLDGALPPVFAGLGVLVLGGAVSIPLVGFQDAPSAEISGDAR